MKQLLYLFLTYPFRGACSFYKTIKTDRHARDALFGLLWFFIILGMVLYMASAYASNCKRAFSNEEYVDILIRSDQLKQELNIIIKNIGRSFDKVAMQKRFEIALKHRRFIAHQISKNLLKMDIKTSRFQHMKDIRDEIDKENLAFTNWMIK